MISSWRRTLRWLGAKPPGRSLMARRSLITQVKLRGGIPAAHLPFTRDLRRPSPAPVGAVSVRSEPPGLGSDRSDQHRRLDGGGDVVDPDHPCPLGHGPGGGGQRTGEALGRRGALLRRSSAASAPRKLLRLVPTITG